MRQLPTIKTEQIKKNFTKELGISWNEEFEIGECFPASYFGVIQTPGKSYEFKFTYEARAKKGTFKELK